MLIFWSYIIIILTEFFQTKININVPNSITTWLGTKLLHNYFYFSLEFNSVNETFSF